MFRIEIRAQRARGHGAFLGAHDAAAPQGIRDKVKELRSREANSEELGGDAARERMMATKGEGVHWNLYSVPEFPVPCPMYERDYGELLSIAKRVCRKRGGWIFVIDEEGVTLVAQEWKDGAEIEDELSGYFFLFPHDPGEFRQD